MGGKLLQSFFPPGIYNAIFFKVTVQINVAFSWQDLEFNLKLSFIYPPYSLTADYSPKTEAVFTYFLASMALIMLLYACIFNHF